MGVGASRTRKERALNKYTKAASRYNLLQKNNVHINNLYRSSKKSLTWKQKVKKGFSNIYNRIRHFRRRTNNEKIKSAKKRAENELTSAEKFTYKANRENEASARRKLNKKVARMTKAERTQAAMDSFGNKGYNYENDMYYAPEDGERTGPKFRASFLDDYIAAWPHTAELEREYRRRKGAEENYQKLKTLRRKLGTAV
jgi:hypothetical protein